MTTTTEITSAMESWLPDAVVVADLKNTIHKGGKGEIHLDSGTISIPRDCTYDMVSKGFVEQHHDIGFGNCFRADAAVGGVSLVDGGIIRATHCFCTLWYTAEGRLITTDFSGGMPR